MIADLENQPATDNQLLFPGGLAGIFGGPEQLSSNRDNESPMKRLGA